MWLLETTQCLQETRRKVRCEKELETLVCPCCVVRRGSIPQRLMRAVCIILQEKTELAAGWMIKQQAKPRILAGPEPIMPQSWGGS